jgi:type I restriction enzyme, S subunit
MHDVPSGWRRLTLQEITEEQTEKVGGRRQITVLSSTKHYGLVPSNEYFKGRTIYSSDLTGYKLVRRGWFAYATNHLAEGSIGLQQAFELACVSPIYTVFSCAKGVYPPYIFRVLKSPELVAAYGVHEQASVDRRGAVRYRDFGRIEINLPPEHEQRQIVEILDALDSHITAVSRLIGKLHARRQGLAESLVTRIMTEKAPLGSHLLHPPKNGFSAKEVDEWTGLYVLGLGCLTLDGFEPRQLKNVPAKDARNTAALLKDGDLLMSRANTRELVGLVGIYRELGSPCIYPDLMMRLTPTSNCRSTYLEFVLRSNDVRRQIQAMAQGTSESMVKIGGSSIRKLDVAIPPLAEQDRVLDVVAAAEPGIEVHMKEREKLTFLKHGLIDDLLTGRVRLWEAEAILDDL